LVIPSQPYTNNNNIKIIYDKLSRHGTRRSSMTCNSLFLLSMHILNSWSGGPKRLPRPATRLSRNSDNCSFKSFRAFARAFQNSFRKTASLSKSSCRALTKNSFDYSVIKPVFRKGKYLDKKEYLIFWFNQSNKSSLKIFKQFLS
jgi:hypothetical protein